MFEVNFNKIMQDLVSEDIETQCFALESLNDSIKIFAEQAVKGFENTDNPYLIAERLVNLGSIIVKPLENFVESSAPNERRTLASIVLLRFDSHKGLDDVIAELKNKGKDEYLAARFLAESRIPRVGELILERLRKFSLEELQNRSKSIYINNLLSYLNDLEVPLPSDLKKYFEKVKDSSMYKFYSFTK